MNERNETDGSRCGPYAYARAANVTTNPIAKRRRIALCCRPGVSIVRLALKAQINVNPLRKWIREPTRGDAVVRPVPDQ